MKKNYKVVFRTENDVVTMFFNDISTVISLLETNAICFVSYQLFRNVNGRFYLVKI